MNQIPSLSIYHSVMSIYASCPFVRAMSIRNLVQAAAALHHMTVKVRVEEPVGGTPQQRPFRQQRPQNRRPRRR